MAAKHKVTVSVQPTAHRLTSAERRAAQMAALSNKQAELKQEAADRRAALALRQPPATSARAETTTRRPRGR
jgi:hypothetical protein